MTILPCKHGFTPESIDEWLEKQRAECPMCRLQLDSKEIKFILFGSRGRWDAEEFSDYDILIITPHQEFNVKEKIFPEISTSLTLAGSSHM